jgi:hypothetical protein
MSVKIWIATIELLTEIDEPEDLIKKRIENAMFESGLAKVCRVNKMVKKNASSGSFRMDPAEAERLGMGGKKEGEG